MSIYGQLKNLMERAGMHSVLAAVGSAAARRASGEDVALVFDEIWVRRIGGRYLGDKSRFDYYLDEFRKWPTQHKLWLQEPLDYWYYDYSPVPGDVIVDVGAGFGNDALLFSEAVGAQGRVIAIEAHPITYRRLIKTCKWSRLDNVTPLALALGENNGSVRISGDDSSQNNTVAPDVAGDEGFEVKMVRFDDLLDELRIDRINFLKMNIEGAERQALQGMTRTLELTQNLVISCHDFRSDRGEGDYFRTLDFVSKTLTSAGFEVDRRMQDDRPFIRDTIYGRRRGDV